MPAYNDIAWFEIGTEDPAGAEKFYGEVFGWSVDAPDPATGGYRTVSTVDGGMQGGLAPTDASIRGYAIFSVVVEDVAATLQRVVAAGGSVARGPQTTPDGLVFAYLLDPAGNQVGVFTPPQG